MVRFTVEYEAPHRQIVEAFPCPYCKAEPGEPCKASRWREKQGRIAIEVAPHHDRVAVTLGLEVVRTSSVYRLGHGGQ